MLKAKSHKNKLTDFTNDPPMAFAIMRNAHEAFRGALKEMDKALASKDQSSLKRIWKEYQRAVQVHMDMEEIDIFPLLESVAEGSITASGLSEMHTADHEKAHEMHELLTAEPLDWEAVQQSYEAWKVFHVGHFVKEETVMMPLTMKTAPTPEGRCLVVHEKIVTPAEARDVEELKFFAGWCTGKLSKHGSSQQPANVATRVFVRALRSACLKAQWAKLMPSIRSKCKPEIWDEMVDKYNIAEAEDDHLLPIKFSPARQEYDYSKALEEINLDNLLASALNSPSARSGHDDSFTKPKQEYYECNCVCM